MEKDSTSNSGVAGDSVWLMRTGPDTVYGNLTLATLVTWAEQGRIVPGCEVSRNNRDWVLAQTVPELKMDWLVELKNGSQYGPVNLLAIPGLLQRGMIEPGALLENKSTGRKMARASLLRTVMGASTPLSAATPAPGPAISPKPTDQPTGRGDVQPATRRMPDIVISEVEQKLVEAEARESRLQKKVEELQTAFNRVDTELQNAMRIKDRVLGDARAETAELRVKHDALATNARQTDLRLTRRINELETLLQERQRNAGVIDEKLRKRDNELTQVRSQLSDLERQLRAVETDRESLHLDLRQERDKHSETRLRMGALEIESQHLQADLSEQLAAAGLHNTVSDGDPSARHAAVEAEISASLLAEREQTRRLTDEIGELKRASERHAQTIAQERSAAQILQSQLNEARRLEQDAQAQVEGLTNQLHNLESLKVQLHTQTGERDESVAALSESQSRVAKLSTERDELKAELARVRQEQVSQADSVRELSSKLESLGTQSRQELAASALEIKKRGEQHAADLERVRAELESAAAARRNLEAQLQELEQGRAASAVATKQQLDAEVRAHAETRAAWDGKMAETATLHAQELKVLRQNLQSVTDAKRELEQQLERHATELAVTTSGSSKRDAELKRLAAELATAHAEVRSSQQGRQQLEEALARKEVEFAAQLQELKRERDNSAVATKNQIDAEVRAHAETRATWVARMAESVGAHAQELSALRQSLQSVTDAKRHVEQQLERHATELAVTTSGTSKRDAELKRLAAELAAAHAEARSSQQARQQLEDVLARKETEYTAQMQELKRERDASAVAAKQQLDAEVRSHADARAEWDARMAEIAATHAQELEALHQNLQSVTDAKRDVEQQIEQHATELSVTASEASKRDVELKRLATELASAHADARSSQQDRRHLEEALARNEAEISKQLQEAKRERDAAVAAGHLQTKELEALRQSLQSVTDAKRDVEQRLERHTTELAVTTSDSSKRDAELKRLATELAAARADARSSQEGRKQAEAALARKEADLSEQLRIATGTKQKLETKALEQLENQATWELRMTEASAAHAKQVKELEKRLEARAGKKERLLAAAKTDAEAKLEKLTEALEAARREIEKRQDSEARMTGIASALRNELAEMQQSSKRGSEALSAAAAREELMQSEVSNLNRQIQVFTSRLAEATAASAEKAEEQVVVMRTDFENRLQTLEADHARSRAEWEQQLKSVSSESDRELETVKERAKSLDRELAELRSAFDKETESQTRQRADLESRLKGADADRTRVIAEMEAMKVASEDEASKAIDLLKQSAAVRESDLEGSVSALRAEMEGLREQLGAQAAEADKRQREWENADAAASQARAELTAAAEARERDLQAEVHRLEQISSEQAGRTAQLDQEMNDLRSELQRVRDESEVALDRARKQEFAFKRIEQELQEVRKAAVSAGEKHRADLASQKLQLEERFADVQWQNEDAFRELSELLHGFDQESQEAHWFVDLGDGKVYGPVSAEELYQWVLDCRLGPGHKISRDKATWQNVEEVAEFGMEWMANLADGGTYGPLNLFAMRQFQEDGVLAPGAPVRSVRDGREGPWEKMLVAEASRLRELRRATQSQQLVLAKRLEVARERLRPGAPAAKPPQQS